MDISSIFPSSDNLYKFLFMGGIFMVAFSFIYPLEKKQKIELEINLYNKQTELLDSEIANIQQDVKELKQSSKDRKNELEQLKFEKNREVAASKLEKIKSASNSAFNKIEQKLDASETKNIILKYERMKIGLLENQVDSFRKFQFIFLVFGVLFFCFGLYRWMQVTSMATSMQKLELEKRKKEHHNARP